MNKIAAPPFNFKIGNRVTATLGTKHHSSLSLLMHTDNYYLASLQDFSSLENVDHI